VDAWERNSLEFWSAGNKRSAEVQADVDLTKAKSVEELEALGLDVLKVALTQRGLKCRSVGQLTR
jgi:hypothetical protein